MVKARKYVAVKHFEGLPEREDYEIVEEELPPLKDGQILVKTEWVSVEPMQRGLNSRYPVPFDQFAYQVGLVQESKDPRYPVGSRVVSLKGWCDYGTIEADKPGLESCDDEIISKHFRGCLDKVYKLPDLGDLSNSLGVGAVGMPGATAYFGFLELCKPKAGETLVVTGAAGAVGSLVGQIAKMKGCKVIGFTGSDEKVRWLEENGFDKAFNYKTADITASLKAAAPDGVDMFFDNVSSEASSLIINEMRDFGRIAVCGMMSTYNEDPTTSFKAGILQPALVSHQLKMEGFIVSRWIDRWPEAFAELTQWISSGKLKPKEHITEGFENIFDAFLGMLTGENIGKAVVKI